MPSSFKSGVPFFKKERVPSTNDDDDVKKKRTRVAVVVVVVVARWCRYNDPSPNTPRPGVGSFREDLFCDDDDDDRARGYVVNGEEEEVLLKSAEGFF